MIDFIRDLITVAVFAAAAVAIIVHTIRQEFRVYVGGGVIKRPVKFQGSAATWVK
jgi:hypothetical protein